MVTRYRIFYICILSKLHVTSQDVSCEYYNVAPSLIVLD
jgi:hypothetical protein